MTALEMPAQIRPMARKGTDRLPSRGSSCAAMSMAELTSMPRITVPAVIMTAPVMKPPMIMEQRTSNSARGICSGSFQVWRELVAWMNRL